MRDSKQSAALVSEGKVPTSKKFIVSFDEPTDWSKRVRWLRLSGWCVAISGELLTALRVRLRERIFPGSFDRERPDVAEHLGIPTVPLLCGFTVDVRIPRGKSELRLEVAAENGVWRKAFSRVVRGPWFLSKQEEQREIALAQARTRYDFWFDRPTDWNQPRSTLYISGWCVDRKGAWIHGIRAQIGSQIFEGNFGIERRDIAARYPIFPAAVRSGFAVAVSPPAGRSIVRLDLKQKTGAWKPFFTHEIRGDAGESPEEITAEEALHFSKKSQPPFEVWFDQPTDWDKLGEEIRISGWCVPTRGDSISEMRVRLGANVFPVKYGLPRPDTALALEGYPNALTSGFTAELRTPWGWSNLALEGRIQNGSWQKLFSRRIKGPWFSRRRNVPLEQIGDYAEWIRIHDTLRQSDRQKILDDITQFHRHPLFSVLLPVHNTSPKWLRHAIKSVQEQLYERWQLCIVDDASDDPRLWKIIQDQTRNDSRIQATRRSKEGHICVASNEALAMATGEFIVLLDHDDELAPTALYHAASQLNQRPELQLIYSDEDKLDQNGRRCQPHFKSDWNPDLFTAQNYISHLGIYATGLVREVGGFRVGFEGAQDYDLALRCIERIGGGQIAHLPYVLYHWRMTDQSTAASSGAKPYTLEAAARAVREHLARIGSPATVEPSREIYLRVKHPIPATTPLVSIVIPSRDRVELLHQVVDSIFSKTEYPNYELVVVDNESSEKETLAFLEQLRGNNRVLIEPVAGPFNFSKLNNIGVGRARGNFVALLNNDLEVINPGWLTEMLSHAIRPGVGAVGARLWYPDGTLQHGGVILGFGGVAGHIHGGTRDNDGYFCRQHLTQDLSAVTAACMLVRKSVYQEMNGFDEVGLAVAFNDVDFCLRLRRAGYRIIWTPYAEFFHHESASRGIEDTAVKQRRFFAEEKYICDKWHSSLEIDPFYNPNLSLETKLFTLAFPPRLSKPWERVFLQP